MDKAFKISRVESVSFNTLQENDSFLTFSFTLAPQNLQRNHILKSEAKEVVVRSSMLDT